MRQSTAVTRAFHDGHEQFDHALTRPPRREPQAAVAPIDDRIHELAMALTDRVTELASTSSAADRVVLNLPDRGVRWLLLRSAPATGMLSPREREIARMVASGHTNKAIANVLEISLYTVSAHLRRIFSKLDVQSRAAMVAILSGDLLYDSPADKSRPRT
jgi:DNA-binding CsgD family transcriptional regulator